MRPLAKAPSMRDRRCVDAVPVFRNCSLCLIERQAACADFRVKMIFDPLVFVMRSAVGDGRFKRLRP